METGSGRLFLILGLLGAAAAIATIYQVFFQAPQTVVVSNENMRIAAHPAAPAKSRLQVEQVAAMLALSTQGQSGPMTFQGLTLTSLVEPGPIEDVRIGVWFMDDDRPLKFVTMKDAYVPSFQQKNKSFEERVPASATSAVICLSFVADGQGYTRLEQRDLAAPDARGSWVDPPHSLKPKIIDTNAWDCDDTKMVSKALNFLQPT